MLNIKYQQVHLFPPERAEIYIYVAGGFWAGDNEINLISLKKRDQRHRAFEALISLQNIHLLLYDLSVV